MRRKWSRAGWRGLGDTAADAGAANPTGKNDPIDTVDKDESTGCVTTTYKSGAFYWSCPDGMWKYTDENGFRTWGDAAGNKCDDTGYCTPGWQGGFFDQLAGSLGISTATAEMIVIGGGALVLIMLFMGGHRKR